MLMSRYFLSRNNSGREYSEEIRKRGTGIEKLAQWHLGGPSGTQKLKRKGPCATHTARKATSLAMFMKTELIPTFFATSLSIPYLSISHMRHRSLLGERQIKTYIYRNQLNRPEKGNVSDIANHATR